jgi:mono/diheme cytochrome c family protein
MPRWKRVLIALGLFVGVAAVAGACAFVALRSRAVLEARHARPASAVVAADSAEAVACGAHLVVVTDCIGCHGADLSGQALSLSGSTVYAANLTLAAKKLSDADLDRAIRRGLRPDATSELAMPSFAYANFSDDEVAAIIGYLRGLPARATAPADAPLGPVLRADLALGLVKTSVARLAEADAPIDAGPGFEAGRHLAGVACGQCHGADLAGGYGLPGPGLSLQGYYSRVQFHALMRTGVAVSDGDTELMSQTARRSFSHFSDGEIDAIFDYLAARDRILAAAAKRSE